MKRASSTCLAYAVLAIKTANGFVAGPVTARVSRSTRHLSSASWTRDGRSSALLPSSHRRRASAAASSRSPQELVRMVAAPPEKMVAAAVAKASAQAPGTADLDWANLGFEYRDVNSHVKFTCKDGRWDEGEMVRDPYVKVHIANTALHYGQSVFEGLKAFHSKDGSVNLFRPDENAKRIKASAERILMEPPPPELFIKACKMAVQANMEFVPPYGSEGALYLRPLLFGTGARIGLQPSDEYTLLVMAIPVGNYYKEGMKPTTAVVVDDFDRAAPKGVGAVKAAGNYAADMLPNMQAKKAGYPIALYLDAQTNSLVEEFSTSNFFAVTHDNKFVTPDSPAVLPSITNKSLMELARDQGMVVERRPVPFSEVGSFKEVAACGTAVVMTSIKSIVKGNEMISINGGSDETGPVCQALYDRVRGVQAGEVEDKFGWMVPV
eukprot:jgi/Undpi1/13896/HiC_scaffold_9.g03547.m1